MRKKEYERPAMQVVELKQKPTLLAGSEQVDASVGDVEWQEHDI